jgi:predicted RNase H-like HicB family nuclease
MTPSNTPPRSRGAIASEFCTNTPIQAFIEAGLRHSRWQTLRRPCARHIRKYFEAGWPEGATLMRYAVVIEKADGNYSAYVPDLPGCVATGATVKAVETEIRDAIRFHIDGLKEDGLPVPMATSIADYVET